MTDTVGTIYVTGYSIGLLPLSGFGIAQWYNAGQDPADTTSSGGPYVGQPSGQIPCNSTAPADGPLPGNLAMIRAKATELWAQMQTEASYNRYEWGGIVFLAPNGGYYVSPIVTSHSASIVRLSLQQLLPPGCTAVAWVHTHPNDGTWQGSPSEDDFIARDELAASNDVDDNLITYVVDLRGTDKMREYLINAPRSQRRAGPQILC